MHRRGYAERTAFIIRNWRRNPRNLTTPRSLHATFLFREIRPETFSFSLRQQRPNVSRNRATERQLPPPTRRPRPLRFTALFSCRAVTQTAAPSVASPSPDAKLKVVRCGSPYAPQALALARGGSPGIRHDTIHRGTVHPSENRRADRRLG